MRSVFLAAIVLGLAACDTSDDSLRFDLVLYDGNGAIVSTGEITFEDPVLPQSTVSGEYRLDVVNVTPNQNGRLRAQCSGGGVSDEDILQIHLDVDVADAGVILEGTCLAGVSGGEWSQITIEGTTSIGRYELTP
ncbi:MAG: hypothetical protein Rubg2KO_06570 [Rubricoccaceae bacterium]